MLQWMRNYGRWSLGLLCLVGSSVLEAGPYATLGPNWNNFVFEPLEEEETPNYYGYGGRLSFGYSVRQVWDLGLYGHYSPGRLESAAMSQADALLYHVGAETALRIGKAVYIGVRGGPASYSLQNKVLATEVDGDWAGVMGQGSLGLLLPTSKSTAWQASLDIGQASMTASDGSSTKARTLSHISLTLAFVYNGYLSSGVDAALFNQWIKGLAN